MATGEKPFETADMLVHGKLDDFIKIYLPYHRYPEQWQ